MTDVRPPSRDMRRHQLAATVLVVVVTIGIAALGGNQDTAPAAVPPRRGGHLYQRMCAVCHGPTGAGYKADQAPAITHPEFLAAASDAFLRNAIVNGRAGTTMSAWAVERGSPLVAADIDAVIGFLRGWNRRPRATLDERPVSGNVLRGGEIYARECARCHGGHGTGGPFVNIGNPQLLSTATNGFLRHAIRYGRPGTAMPAFASTLGEEGVEDLVALLRNWEQSATMANPAPAHPPPIPLGPVPLNPKGPEPIGFRAHPTTTSIEVVKSQLDRHAKMALLDARAPSDYTFEHLAGAVSVPFYDIEPYVSALPRDTWLVCYCSCPHAESSQLAQALVAKGFTRVTVLDEGLGVWKMKKYPMSTGTLP
jgi:cytochrome c oxidase cbb3-type subunit 3/ubiquinol-cytochrome c reductase cytochrome c subunit